jgi:hypothetical protein
MDKNSKDVNYFTGEFFALLHRTILKYSQIEEGIKDEEIKKACESPNYAFDEIEKRIKRKNPTTYEIIMKDSELASSFGAITVLGGLPLKLDEDAQEMFKRGFTEMSERFDKKNKRKWKVI